MARIAQTLPRHTNLASQSLRLVSAIVDIAIGLALTLGMFFGCFNLIFNNKTTPLQKQVEDYRVDSHLLVRKEDGTITTVENKSEVYEASLEGYYLRYLPGKPLEGEKVAPNWDKPFMVDGKEVLPQDYYNVRFFNKEVLGITQENPDGEKSASYFTYKKDAEGNFLYDEIAVPRSERYNPDTGAKEEITDTILLGYYQEIYVTAFYHFAAQEFYQTALNELTFYYSLAIVLAIFVAGLVTYIVLPLFLKNGQTLGKKIFKIGLASYDGYKYHEWQLLLRFVPFLIVDVSLLLPIWNNIFLVFAFVVVVLLISFALMMASPKRAALHDFAARTIVVDLNSSIIFENELEEEAFIEKEDNLPKEVYAGEEPELKYER